MKIGKLKRYEKKIYILDTSALLTYIEDEEGADFVENLLIKAEKGKAIIYIAFISLTEIFYITTRERNEKEALKRITLIQSLELSVEESNETLNINAGKLKASYRISLADSYIAALAQKYNGILVHKDPEFNNLSHLIKEYILPYK